MSTHTQFSRGKRIRIVFRDGTVWVRKFIFRHARTLEVADEAGAHTRIAIRQIEAVNIYKAPRSCAEPPCCPID